MINITAGLYIDNIFDTLTFSTLSRFSTLQHQAEMKQLPSFSTFSTFNIRQK
jgi:hypothetical protein